MQPVDGRAKFQTSVSDFRVHVCTPRALFPLHGCIAMHVHTIITKYTCSHESGEVRGRSLISLLVFSGETLEWIGQTYGR